MKIEIAIDGPAEAISDLFNRLDEFSPMRGEPVEMRENLSRILVLENPKKLDGALHRIFHIAGEVEKELHPDIKFEFRTRNLAHSESSTDQQNPRKPFNPTQSIQILPWHKGITEPKGSNTILIESLNAFGDGRHPTTRLCLAYLEQLSQGESGSCGLKGREVLDFGCGTALLAIAAIRLGALGAFCVDMDEHAVSVAKKNIAINKLSDKIRVQQGSWDIVVRNYDLVIANVVASVLFRNVKKIPYHLKAQGKAIVSGFSDQQAGQLVSKFQSVGISTINISNQEGWSAMLLVHEK